MTDRSGRTFEEYRELYWAEKKRRKELEATEGYQQMLIAQLKQSVQDIKDNCVVKDERLLRYEIQLAAVSAKLKACLKFSRKQADIIEQASTLPTYLCEFPDIGKMGAAVRKRDLDAAIAGEEDE